MYVVLHIDHTAMDRTTVPLTNNVHGKTATSPPMKRTEHFPEELQLYKQRKFSDERSSDFGRISKVKSSYRKCQAAAQTVGKPAFCYSYDHDGILITTELIDGTLQMSLHVTLRALISYLSPSLILSGQPRESGMYDMS